MGDDQGSANCNGQVLPPTDPFSIINVLQALAQIGAGGREARWRRRVGVACGPGAKSGPDPKLGAEPESGRGVGPKSRRGPAFPIQ